MIPDKTVSRMFASVVGEKRLFSTAQRNVIGHLGDLQSSGARAYLAHNGKLESENITNGKDRLYWFPNTEIDGSYLSKFKESPDAEPLVQSLGDDDGFQAFKEHVEQGSKGLLTVEPYVDAQNANGNVRFGMRVTAESNESFNAGLEALTDFERPENYGSGKLSGKLPKGRMFKNLEND